MLNPHTPPGTKIVCINAADCEGYLYDGQVYTLRAWVEDDDFNSNGGVPGITLEEIDVPMPFAAYHPRRFRVAVLPKCLTDLLVPEMV